MAEYTDSTTIGQILREHPEASDLFNPAVRIQLDRFTEHSLAFARPWLGLTSEKLQALLTDLNKL